MSRQESRLVCVMMLCVALAAFGCSKKAEKASTEENTAANGETTTENAAPHGTAQTDTTPTLMLTTAEIWSQIETERNKLSAAITNGELASVRPFAFGIRELVVSLADKATTTDPSSASKIQALVERVETSVSNLAEYGDERNSAAAATELETLNTVMTDIEAAVPLQ